jgi:hypothetical protein
VAVEVVGGVDDDGEPVPEMRGQAVGELCTTHAAGELDDDGRRPCPTGSGFDAHA